VARVARHRLAWAEDLGGWIVIGLVKFPDGQFKEGDIVRLKKPGEQNLFDKPRGELEVAGVHWRRPYEMPTYALQERGGSMAVTPFRDDDLVLLRRR
jgi:hypothetical protein